MKTNFAGLCVIGLFFFRGSSEFLTSKRRRLGRKEEGEVHPSLFVGGDVGGKKAVYLKSEMTFCF